MTILRFFNTFMNQLEYLLNYLQGNTHFYSLIFCLYRKDGYVLQPKGWGHIVFGAEPISDCPCCFVSFKTLSFESMDRFGPSLQDGKNWLDFGDLDLNFKVTMMLLNVKKKNPHAISWNEWWNLTKIDAVTVAVSNVNFWPEFRFRTLSLEPNSEFWPKFIYGIIKTQ